jgi:peptidoglycan/xylan/chitin deacetylase (PgdA/CDA1 family)
VGAHTLTHPVLAALPEAAQRDEIRRNKECLEALLGRPVKSFAYPYGTRADYTRQTVRLVREAGFACACANVPGVISQRSDPFQIPRFIVRNWDGEEFARRLEAWFDG